MNYLYISKKLFKSSLYQLLLLILTIHTIFSQNNPALEKKFTINFEEFKAKLQPGVELRGASERDVLIEFPTPEGDLKQFQVIEIHIMSAQMEAQFPDIKNYKIFDTNNPKHSGTITTSMLGINATIYGEEGLYFIEILDKRNLNEYKIYYNKKEGIECGNGIEIEPSGGASMDVEFRANSCFQNGGTLKTYRMAIAVTDEYRDGIGGGTIAGTVAAINNTIMALNAIYERELSIRFVVAGTPFISPIGSSDTFVPQTAAECSSGSEPASGGRTVQANNIISANFTAVPYDIGHVFHQGCGGGLAGSPICSGNRARGWSATSTATGSSWVNLLAHEVAHQFGAAHTFNSQSSGCSGNISMATSYEPGAGNSIMAYGGSCGVDNVGGRIDYFGAHSLQQILNTVNTSGTCAAMTATGNNAPTANANPTGTTYIIPKGAAFALTGSGSDPDSDILTYSWEQYDAGVSSPSPPSSGATLTTGPLFQMLPPSSSPTRNFNDSPPKETLPLVARTLNFRLVVRDNHTDGINGANTGVACDAVMVQVVDDVFKITSQNTATTWMAGRQAPITWTTSGANGSGANCANLDFFFSTDGGVTYTPLLTNTPNDGSQTITIPNTPTEQGRIKMKCTGNSNIFYDLNDVNINIVSSCTAQTSTFTPTNSVTGLSGDAALDLNLNYQYPSLASKTFTINAVDNTMSLVALNNNPAACSVRGNTPYYETFTFNVLTNGSHTISVASGTLSSIVLNLYQAPFDPLSGCTNHLTSNATRPSNAGNFSLGGSISATLSTGINYVLVISGFSAGQTGTADITFSPNVLDVMPSGLLYTYAIINSSGTIKKIDTSSDLTTCPAGTYTVYGLSYLNSEDLSSYVGQPLSTLQTAISNNTICASVSTNNKMVTITGGCTPPVITTQPLAQTKCVGTAASFTVAATTGTGTLTYQWQKNGADISGATSATYDIPSVTAADAANYSVIISNNGVGGTCNSTSSAVTLAVDALPTTANAGPNQTLCGTSEFTLAANLPTTGIGRWSVVANSVNIVTPTSNTSLVNSVNGAALLRWTISNGVCTPSTSDVILKNDKNPIITAIPAAEVCFGATKVITVSGTGTGTLQYAICAGAACTNFGANQASNTFTQGAGNYVVQVTDGNGCKGTAPVSITQPSAALGITVNPKANVLCIGGNTGSLTLFPAGGTAPYTFRICKNCNAYADPKTAATTGDFVKYENLTAGIYNIEITDAKDCKKVISETINEPTTLTATVTPTPATNCTTPDGIINIVATGGTGAYTYELNGASKPAVITGLAPNTYTVLVKDVNGCTFTTMTTVTSPTSPTAFTVTSDSTKICVGQSTKIKVSGSQTGVNYQLLLNGANLGAPIAGTSAAIEFTNISGQGTYSVKATDAANCMTTMSGAPSLLVNPYSPAPLVTTPAAVCENGTHTITPTADAKYPIEYLYDFTGNSIAATISGTGAPLAFGYSLGTNATGGFSGGAAYTVSGINSGDTDKFIEFQVSPFNAANLTIMDISFDILRDADGASNYQLRTSLDGFATALSIGSIATSVATKTIAGTYIAPANGITFRLYLTGSNTNAGVVTIDNIKLKGTTALSGSFEYYSDAALTTKIGTGASQAINSASTPSTATAGAKKVYVAHRSAANCLSAATEVTINVTKPAINAGMDVNICSGKTATLAAMGTGTFAWNNGLSAVANPTTPALTTSTTYTVTLTDANNCTATDAVVVNVRPLPTLTIVNPPAVCAPNTVDITSNTVQTANDGTTTKYYSTNALAEAGAAGDVTTQTTIAASSTYYIRSEFGNGCYIVKPVTVTIYPNPTVNAGVDVSICPRTTTTLAAMGIGTFAWSHGLSAVADPTTPAVSTTTTYTVTLTDANNCTATDAVTVNIKPLPAGRLGSVAPICENQTAMLTASGGDTYSWNKGLGTGTPVTTPALTVTTTYTVTIMGANGCSMKDSVEVRVNLLPTAAAAATAATCIAGTTNANADGKITITGFTTEKHAYSSGNTYTGAIITFAAATAIPADGIIVNNLANPAAATQQYTVRIFTANDCYIDRVVTLNKTDCSCTAPSLTNLLTQIICVGGTFNASHVKTSSDIPVTYQWYNDNGSGNANSDVLVGETSATLGTLPTAEGEYIYRVEATSTANAACKTSKKVFLFIRPIPTTTPVAVSATCIAGTSIANNDAKIKVTDFGAFYKYDYKIGAGAFTGTLTGIPANGEILTGIANPASAITYTVRILSVNNSGCFVDREVVLNPTVCTCTPALIAPITNQTLCLTPTTVLGTITTSITNGVAVTYQWYNDNGALNPNTNALAGETGASLTLLTPPAAVAGVLKYRVEATRTDDPTCKSSQTVTITLVTLPNVTATRTNVTCTGATANSDGKIVLSGLTTEKYDFTLGITYIGAATYATATNPAMNALPNPAAGTTQDYTVRIFNSNNCFIDRIVTLEYVNCTCTVVATNTTISACATTFPGTIGLFNLNFLKQFISTTAGAVISFYPTLTDAQAGTNIIANPTAYSSAAGTITAKVANAAGTCANFATITLRVFDCRMRLTDPCACRNNATTPTNGQFNETIEVEAPAGQTWFIQSVSGLYAPASTATNLIPFVTGAGGVTLTDIGPSMIAGLRVYQLLGVHVDAIGYDIVLENSLGATLSQPRTICYYPRISVGNLPSGGCKGGDGAFTFNAFAPNASISYELDGVALASASVGNLGVGNHTLTIIADAGAPSANNPNDPGCIVRQTVQFSIANPNLTPDCKGYMTLSLGNCQDKLYPQQLLNSFNVDISDLTLELRDKNNKILPNNFITPAQVGQEVYAKLTYGCNGKTCETTIFVQDNNAPTAYSPEDGVITCTQYRELLAKGEFTPKKLAELFGNFSANDNCTANLELIEGISTDSVRINDCANRGFILRTFSAQEKYGYRRIAKTTQKITFLNDQNFRVKFPSNQSVSCTETLTAKKPTVEGVGCENVQVNYRDEVFTSANIGEAKQCYKIIRHWTVINMCHFNPTRNNYLPEGDADINYDYSYVKDTIIANYFTDARGTALNDNVLSKIDAAATSGFSPLLTGGAATLSDKLTFNPNIIAGTRTIGFVVDGRIKEDVVYIRDYSGDGVIRYTQVLNIVDNESPTFATCPKEMQTIVGSNFTNDCRANVTIENSATDNCSAADKITYSYTIKPFGTTRETDWIQGSTNRFANQLPITKAADQPHLMTWRATDACGNTRECTFPFRVLDAKKPTITAQNISTTLMANNTLSVGVSKFVLMGNDNCTPMPRLRFAFSENLNDTVRLFTCKDYPSNIVKIFVIDEANNFATAEAIIRFAQTATSINCNEVSFSTVGGVINNPEGVPIKATTSIVLDNQPSNIEDVVGDKFSFKLRNGGTYIVQPTRINDLLNGVTTYDLIKIQQHILDAEVLDSPYKIIAADVNKDGKVTLLDIIELRKAILKLSYSFNNNQSWRFLQKSYTIKDKQNPIDEELPSNYKLTNLNTNNAALDFIAIKVGDVNGNAQNAFSNTPVVEERNRPDAVHFLVEDRMIQPNERIAIPIKADAALNLSGFQTTLHFEDAALAFEGFDANALPISNNNIGIFNGIVTMSWNTPTTMRLSKEETLFTLTFRAKKAMLLSEALFSSSQYTVSEIYTLKNNDISTISPLEIAFTKNNEPTTSNALYQNIPNPFEDETTISFRLAKAQKVTVSITDVTGKILKVIQQDAFAGYNELTINNLPTKGVLYYHLETPTFKASKKMVSVR